MRTQDQGTGKSDSGWSHESRTKGSSGTERLAAVSATHQEVRTEAGSRRTDGVGHGRAGSDEANIPIGLTQKGTD